MSLCCDYNAGMLTQVVSFERMTLVSDGAGGQTQTWTAISGAPTRAHVKAVSGSERFNFNRINADIRYKITCRYSSALRESDSVVFRGIRHNIRFIDNVEMADKWLEMAVEAGVAS